MTIVLLFCCVVPQPSLFRSTVMATAEVLQELIRSPGRLRAVVEEAKMLAYERGMVIRTQDAPNSSEVCCFFTVMLLAERQQEHDENVDNVKNADYWKNKSG